MMVYICTKFYENILNRIRVMERTRKVNGRTDGRPDRRTDGQWARHNTTCLCRAYNKNDWLLITNRTHKLVSYKEHICLSHTKCSKKKHFESFCSLPCVTHFDIVSFTYGNSILKRFLQKRGNQEIIKVVSICENGEKTWTSAHIP